MLLTVHGDRLFSGMENTAFLAHAYVPSASLITFLLNSVFHVFDHILATSVHLPNFKQLIHNILLFVQSILVSSEWLDSTLMAAILGEIN